MPSGFLIYIIEVELGPEDFYKSRKRENSATA